MQDTRQLQTALINPEMCGTLDGFFFALNSVFFSSCKNQENLIRVLYLQLQLNYMFIKGASMMIICLA